MVLPYRKCGPVWVMRTEADKQLKVPVPKGGRSSAEVKVPIAALHWPALSARTPVFCGGTAQLRSE